MIHLVYLGDNERLHAEPMAGHLKRIDLPTSALAGALIESWLSVCRHMWKL